MDDASDEQPLTRLRGAAVVRQTTTQALGAAMGVAGALCLVAAVLDGWRSTAIYACPAILFGLAGWAAFWCPRVEVSDGGVRIVNTLRTIDVPWPAVDDVDGRYGLRLETAYGRFTAWGAAAPSGRARMGPPESNASQAVRQRLEELRRAGHLDDRRLERPSPLVRWHWPVIAAALVLAAATVVLPAVL